MKNQEITWLLREKYHGEKSAAFFADCERLAAGTPLAYLIGSIPFLHTTIFLDSYPLIPRPETEYWTGQAIQHCKSILPREAWVNPSNQLQTIHKKIAVLDLCAGSGAIGIAVASAVPSSHVTFAEIDPAHLPTIARNCTYNDITTDRYTLVQSDLYKQVAGTFDLILSNPPYIDKLAGTVDESVTAHEPHLALFGGDKGLTVIERIIAGARAMLAPHGQLWIEHEPFQSIAIAAIAHQHDFTAVTYTDQYHTERYSVLIPHVTQ